ncbi:MAG: hypothetical protein LBE07_02170 [Gordonia sp. (in: high G+C Gram-positive bacteria)]|nr:hypothetical protein [Gordonia sp. (in: high G+C Gram-positive bacteria)]
MIQASDLNTMGTEVNQAVAKANSSQTLAEAADGKATSALSTANNASAVAVDAADAAAVAGETAKWAGVTEKPMFFPPESHTHGTSDVDDLEDFIDDTNRAIAGVGVMADILMQGGDVGQVWTSGGPDGEPSWETPTGGGGGSGLPPTGDVESGGVLRLDGAKNPQWEPMRVRADDEHIGIGGGSDPSGYMACAVGSASKALAMYSSVFGPMGSATSIMSTSVGGGDAQHPGSLALGGMTILDPTSDPDDWSPVDGEPPFTPGPPAQTTEPNQIMLGNVHHSVEVPGQLVIGEGTARVILSTSIDGGDVVLHVRSATGDPVRIEPEGA